MRLDDAARTVVQDGRGLEEERKKYIKRRIFPEEEVQFPLSFLDRMAPMHCILSQ